VSPGFPVSPTWRAALALSLLSLWMAGLFSAVFVGGAVHLLFVGSLLLFPWRALRAA
jgi:hypothetical protein